MIEMEMGEEKEEKIEKEMDLEIRETKVLEMQILKKNK